MKTVAVASQKGGTGKSMLAIQLGVAAQIDGLEVLVVDLDTHSKTTAEWAAERDTGTPVVVTAHEEDLEVLQSQAAEEGFELLILDCPPYLDSIVDAASNIADFTLIPARPYFADIRSLPRVIDSMNSHHAVLLNACPPGLDGKEAIKTTEVRCLLNDSGLQVSPLSLTHSEKLAGSLDGGGSVIEIEPDSNASKEIINLWKWLKGGLESMSDDS